MACDETRHDCPPSGLSAPAIRKRDSFSINVRLTHAKCRDADKYNPLFPATICCCRAYSYTSQLASPPRTHLNEKRSSTVLRFRANNLFLLLAICKLSPPSKMLTPRTKLSSHSKMSRNTIFSFLSERLESCDVTQ